MIIEKTNKVFLQITLGLKEAIVCNGMIRELLKIYDEVTIPANASNRIAVQRMFKDLPANKLRVLMTASTGGENEKAAAYQKFSKMLELTASGAEFDKKLYEQAGIPFEKRWEAFHVQRNVDREVHIVEKDFAFVINNSQSQKIGAVAGLKTYQMMPLSDIFDWCLAIETAREVHVHDGPYLALVDSLKPKGKLVLHGNTDLTLKLSWEKLPIKK